MRIVLIVVACLALLVVSMWVVGRAAQHRAEEQEWPAGLGALKDAPRHFPSHGTTPAAVTLNRLAEPLGLDLIVLSRPGLKHDPRTVTVLQYVPQELERNEVAVQVPAPVARYLADHAQHLTALRQQALTGGPIAFAVDLAPKEPPEPDILAIWQLCRLVIADALDRAGRGDRVAWDDLEAAWRIARPLFDRPEQQAQFVAAMTLQSISGAARRMPLPAPVWLAELGTVDMRRSYLASLQANNWRMLRDEDFLGVVMRNGVRLADGERWVAHQLAAETRCAFDATELFRSAAKRMSNGNAVGLMQQDTAFDGLDRLFRTRAELELTDRVLAARSGAAPNPRSACPDGNWIYEGTTIRFSEELEPPAQFAVRP